VNVFAMHIPDGFLSNPVAAVTAGVAIVAVAAALRSGRELDEESIPLLGVLAAFVFAVQMLNFPIAGGTSGHLLGAALVTALLGPRVAFLVLTVVLVVQAVVFADGGITALGANIVNMGVCGAVVAGGVLAAGHRLLPRSRNALLGTVAVASWLAVMAGAVLTSVELAVSGTIPLGTVLPAMLGVHALIGAGEAVITVAAVGAVLSARPDLVAARA
jgi:cobalt/nickel transport system permease protein